MASEVRVVGNNRPGLLDHPRWRHCDLGRWHRSAPAPRRPRRCQRWPPITDPAPLSPEKPHMSRESGAGTRWHEGCSVTLPWYWLMPQYATNTDLLTDANPLVSFQLLIRWFAISAQSLAHSNTMLGCCEPWMHQGVERSNNKSFYSNDAQLPHKETSKARWLCPVLSETAAPFSFLSIPVNPHKQLSWHLLLLGRMKLKWVWSEFNPSRFGRHFDLHAIPFNVFLAEKTWPTATLDLLWAMPAQHMKAREPRKTLLQQKLMWQAPMSLKNARNIFSSFTSGKVFGCFLAFAHSHSMYPLVN